MHEYIERVVDLLPPGVNQLYELTDDEARGRVLAGDPDGVLGIKGSFALIAKDGKTVRLARSLDRPMRYFLAKRHEGPALVVSDRIDRIHEWLKEQGFGDQFHPGYTRMVPAHYIVEIQLVGCPDPDPVYTRFFDPRPNTQPKDIPTIGRNYIGALADEIALWLRHIPQNEPIGCCFSGGLDSGAVFLTTYHVLRKLGMNPSRLKAFTLSLGGEGEDLAQARRFLDDLGLGLFLEAIEEAPESLDLNETLRVLEDYKVLDVQCAAMGLALCRGIRRRYPDWRHLIDGDGGDENLKDYPIEENPELTIRSVLHNQMLYHEGWGVGRIKHSLTYSGGLSRGYARTYAPLSQTGFAGFSPFTRPGVIAVAEGIPYVDLTGYEVRDLYSLKGLVIQAGMRGVFGGDIPVVEKRRFQHGAGNSAAISALLGTGERELRRDYFAEYQ